MASCPNCGRKLKITDFKPDCPGCGVNLLFFNNEERLMDEAEKAEAEHVSVQRRIDRMKASYVGSPLTIARIVFYVLPLALLLLPLFSLTNGDTVRLINLISIYSHVEVLDFGKVLGYVTGGTGTEFAYALTLLTAVASILFDLLGLIFITMAGGKLGNLRNIFFGLLTVASAAASTVYLQRFLAAPSAVIEYESGRIGAGVYIYVAALTVCLLLNLVIAIRGNEVKYTECLVGGIPSDEYFKMVEDGVPREEIRSRMKEAIEKIEKENERRAAEHNERIAAIQK